MKNTTHVFASPAQTVDTLAWHSLFDTDPRRAASAPLLRPGPSSCSSSCLLRRRLSSHRSVFVRRPNLAISQSYGSHHGAQGRLEDPSQRHATRTSAVS
ncbi:hypothetical protein BD309DRAFT_866156 [Dichomitus squalens]|uniref:Uncharacterized protein n=1 Tax=Dichomitus squalens TaxID=114155 RepID=A0A4Q9NM51_9APHY|nr:hypothetical protein BD309DRAFT_866156 [Dichomitus squalens]TBU66105.1 hypothetical protein BD310DRAFT_804686 [Dichomitus squalens]